MEKVRLAVQEWYEKDIPEMLPRMIDPGRFMENDFIVDIIGSRRSGKPI